MKPLPGLKTDFFFSASLRIFLIRFFPSLAATIVMILFSRKLSGEIYGTYQLYLTQALLLSAIGSAGIQALLITYPSSFVAHLVRSVTPRQYLIFGLWTLLLSIVFSLLQPVAAFSSVAAFIFLFAYILHTVAEAILTAYRRFNLLTGINLLYTVVFLWLHSLLLLDILTLSRLLLYLAFLSVIKAAVCIRMVRQYPAQKALEATTTPASVKKLWLHLGLNDVLQLVFKWVDKFVLGFFLSRELFAIYYNGSVDIPFLPLLLGAAANAVLIQMAMHREGATTPQTIQLIHHASRLLSSFVFPLFSLLVLYRYELFTVVFTHKYEAAVPVFLIATLILPLRAYSFTAILQHRHQGKTILAGSAGDLLLACMLMYPLYLILGLPGVALAFVLSTYAQAWFYLRATARVLQTNMLQLVPWKSWLIKALISGGLLLLLRLLTMHTLPDGGQLLSGIMTAMVLSVAFLVLEIRRAGKSLR